MALAVLYGIHDIILPVGKMLVSHEYEHVV